MTHRGEPTQAYDFDEENSNTSANPTFDSVLGARLSRRGLLRGGVATAGTAVLGAFSLSACGGSDDPAVPAEKLLGFTAVGKSLADKLVIPAGYTASVVYALGDPLQAGVAGYKNDGTDTDYDKRAGDHHDGMEWFGLGADGKRNDSSVDRGLLGMNHEATTDEKLSSFFLHANGGTSTLPRPASEVDKELAIHGVSVASGVAGFWLSWRWKMPIITAWSTPGAALLLTALPGVPYGEAVGAYLAAGLIVTLVGVSGAFDRLMQRFPAPLAAALLGGILFHFVADVAAAAHQQALLVGPMTALFFVGRRWFPRFALLAAIALGLVIAGLGGQFAAPGVWQGSSGPSWTTPAWSWAVFVNLGLPLAVLALTSQFLPGMAVLKASGYDVPARSPVTTLGVASILSAPFGGHGVKT